MREAGIGRVLVASLHQGIADLLPMRLGFYENWLNAEGLRDGTIGLAPLYAVLSFLRQEGDAYQPITAQAGDTRRSGRWSRCRRFSGDSSRRRRLAAFAGCCCASRDSSCASSYQGSRAVSRLRRGTASVDVRSSIFCTVREPVPQPLCGFYAAAFTRLLALFDLRGARRGRGVPRHGRADLSADHRHD